ncbi:hypothetical protein [Vibrio phage BONAISHI]|nr:hypothetical protein [Vibrio phage BONAISHI]
MNAKLFTLTTVSITAVCFAIWTVGLTIAPWLTTEDILDNMIMGSPFCAVIGVILTLFIIETGINRLNVVIYMMVAGSPIVYIGILPSRIGVFRDPIIELAEYTAMLGFGLIITTLVLLAFNFKKENL